MIDISFDVMPQRRKPSNLLDCLFRGLTSLSFFALLLIGCIIPFNFVLYIPLSFLGVAASFSA
ncbi:hypothetical protein BDW67DRAFT_162828, partial [Aspergillus spinulosporus]